jgi:hemerythrin-like domain-containing protein
MRRAEALKSLSRDHHHGLVAAQRLRRVAETDAHASRAAFLDFWRQEGEFHFRVEEGVLLPRIARRIEPTHSAVIQVLTDHVELRHRALELEAAEDAPLEMLRETGELLERHIRHEERVLFPLIEEALSDTELEELAQAVDAAERP